MCQALLFFVVAVLLSSASLIFTVIIEVLYYDVCDAANLLLTVLWIACLLFLILELIFLLPVYYDIKHDADLLIKNQIEELRDSDVRSKRVGKKNSKKKLTLKNEEDEELPVVTQEINESLLDN